MTTFVMVNEFIKRITAVNGEFVIVIFCLLLKGCFNKQRKLKTAVHLKCTRLYRNVTSTDVVS